MTTSASRLAPRRRIARRAFVFPILGLAVALGSTPSCTTDTSSTSSTTSTTGPTLLPGDFCAAPSPDVVRLRVEPSRIFLARCTDGAEACAHRQVRFVLDPDVCTKTPITFESSSEGIVGAPSEDAFNLYDAAASIDVVAGKTAGSATITANVDRGDGTFATATLNVEVLDVDSAASDIACTGTASMQAFGGGKTLAGKDGLAGASISLPEGASKPNSGSFLWSVPSFNADISCGTAKPPTGYVPLGPAITFGPTNNKFQRDVPLTIPINPARMPEAARLRHVAVAYSGPAFVTPRIVPVMDARIEKVDGHWALSFKAPRLGTYQAVITTDAGTKSYPRRLSHRGIVGVSMGGGGAAMFGMRHHHLFDVLAPLGGPVDLTWMLQHVESNIMGGFRPIQPGTTLDQIPQSSTPCTTNAQCAADETCVGVLGTAPGKCAWIPAAKDPYEHNSVFNHWWYEYPNKGSGGSFSRHAYIQIFRDFAIMFGNPNGDNLAPGAENLPAGVRPNDPAVIGDRSTDECHIWVDPLDGPNKPMQQELDNNCPIERCSHTLKLDNYFDDEFNPDGTFPVITFCDGSPQLAELTPYANTWTPQGNNFPLELGLAVDYNGNGVRDEMEPVIRSGHEPWSDVGTDGVASKNEPGFMAGVNEDPAGDDYDPQYNPTGTENNYRYEQGEPYQDVGLDGVAGTKQQPAGGWQMAGDGYDVGEGDGKFTVSRGLQRFWDRDAHAIAARMSKDVPGGEVDDTALRRLDVFTDGGTRDLFNFVVDAQHLAGAFVGRQRQVTYYSDFNQQPGLDPANTSGFNPSLVPYDDMPGIVLQRYGKIDPTQADLESGSGQHVGTTTEVIDRLRSGLNFILSRWREPELRTLVLESADDPIPEASSCEVLGTCEIEFTTKAGRKGPIIISLPPGYAHKQQQDRRYPVIYALHGYGQEPQDLSAATGIIRTFMNQSADSMETRMAKAILVFVDGRCRVGPDGKAECIRGTFFGQSPMAQGAKMEDFWLELMEHMEKNYRTMGDSEVIWVE
jgi:hypothetical protein